MTQYKKFYNNMVFIKIEGGTVLEGDDLIAKNVLKAELYDHSFEISYDSGYPINGFIPCTEKEFNSAFREARLKLETNFLKTEALA